MEQMSFTTLFKPCANCFLLLGLTLACTLQVATAQSVEQQIELYLDSNRAAMKQNRADLSIAYLIKAEALAETVKDLNFDLLYSISYDYQVAFVSLGQANLALPYLRKINRLIEADRLQHGTRRHNMDYLNLGKIGSTFLKRQQYDSAFFYYEEARKTALKGAHYRLQSAAYNNLGICHLRNQQPDSAFACFNEAIVLLQLKNETDTLFLASIYDNIADLLIANNNLDSAQKLLEINFQYVQEKKAGFDRFFFRGLELAKLYLLRENYASADAIFPILDSLVLLGKGRWRIENHLALLEAKLQTAQQRDQSARAFHLLRQHDSLQRERYEFEQDYQTSKNKIVSYYITRSIENELRQTRENIRAEQARNRNNLLLFSSLILIATLITVLSITNYRRRLKIQSTEKLLMEKELELTEIRNAELNSELTYKNKDFSQLLMQTNLEEDWNRNIIARLKTIRQEGDKDAALLALVRELNQKLGFYERLKVEQKGMLHANAAFYDRLQQQFPSLTRSERETCGLIRMNIQTKEIAMVRNIDPASVRKLRQRIKKKLHLSVDQDLYTFIQQL